MKKKYKIPSNRLNSLTEIRKNLFNVIKSNKKLNLRTLSRELGKNDAYLQQYIKRGSPNYLPEEERSRLSQILDLNYNELTPNWILKDNKNETLKIDVVKKAIPTDSLYLPIEIFQDMKLSKKENLKFCKFILTNDKKTFIYTIVDFGVTKFEDNNNYILNDNNNLFLVNLSLDKENMIKNDNRLIVKPLEKKFSSFRIKESKLYIFGKIIYKSNNIYKI